MATDSPRAGVRARIVLLTTALLAAVLLPGTLLLAYAVYATERAGLDEQLRRTAAEVVTLMDENRLPTTLPVSGARLVQVVDADGGVVAASLAADRMTSLLSLEEIDAGRAGDALEVPAHRIAESGTLRVLAVPAGPETRQVTVIVAAPVADAAQAQGTLWIGLALGAALILGVGALLSWRAVGAALRPVDELRAGAERIGTTHRRGDPVPHDGRDAHDDLGPSGGEHSRTRLPVPATRDEIQALAVTLNGMLDRLDAAAVAQRRFVSDAAHELRSPVASLRMQVEVAQHLGDAGDLPAELLPDIDRLGRLVDDLLLLARVGSSRAIGGEVGLVDVADVATQVGGRYDHARVPVRVTTTARERALVSADRLSIDRVMANLVDNAVRHAATGVDLAVAVEPEGVIIEVVDDGAGIPKAERERVFDRFVRLDESRDRDAGGSGLGLPIVRELVRRHGGEVTLADGATGAGPTGDDGAGAHGLRVRVVLPQADGPAEPEGSGSSPVSTSP